MSRLSPQHAFYLYKAGFGFSFALMTTVFGLYHLRTAGLNPFQLVAVGAVLEVTCLLLELPTGVVADTVSRKLSVVIGLVLIGLGLGVEGLFPSFGAILLAQVIWGAGATFLSGADIAWLSGEVGVAGAEKVLLRGTRYEQIAAIAGILVSVALATIHLQVPVVASGSAFVLLGAVLLPLMPETAFKGRQQREGNPAHGYARQIGKGWHHLRTHRIMVPFLAVVWLGGLYNEGIDRLWVFRLSEEIGLADLPIDTIWWFAMIQIVLLALNLSALSLLERRIDRLGHRALYLLMAFNNLVLLGALVCFAITAQFYLALLAYWGLMVARGVNDPLATLIMNDTIEDDEIRATVLSMKGLMDQIGQVVGGLLVGWLALQIGVGQSLLLSSGVVVLIVLLLLQLWRKEPKRPDPRRPHS